MAEERSGCLGDYDPKPTDEECFTCDGDGTVHSHNPRCWDCYGTGRVPLGERAKQIQEHNRMRDFWRNR